MNKCRKVKKLQNYKTNKINYFKKMPQRIIKKVKIKNSNSLISKKFIKLLTKKWKNCFPNCKKTIHNMKWMVIEMFGLQSQIVINY